MSSGARSQARLSRADWIRAATAMGAQVGFDNLTVESLAAQVGATKGSFYWHFRDRAELVSAVAEEWARVATLQVIEEVERAPAGDALERLVEVVLGHPESDTTEWRILGATDHPQIGPVVARVHEARIDYVRQLLRSRGLSPVRSAARARVLYAAYLGNLALLDTPGVPDSVKRSSLRREFLAMVEAP